MFNFLNELFGLYSDLYWLAGLCIGLVVGIIAIIILTRFCKKTPKVLNVFFVIFFAVACSISGVCADLNGDIESMRGNIYGVRGWLGNLVDESFGGGSGIVNFVFNGFNVEEHASNILLSDDEENLATALFWRKISFLLSAVCVALIVFVDRIRRKKLGEHAPSDKAESVGNKSSAAVANGKIEVSVDLKEIKEAILKKRKAIAIISMVLYGLIGLFKEAIFILFIGLAFIPAKIAQKKGRDFWTWYVYGIWLWLIAFPHALFIKKKEATSAAETQGNEQPVPAN